MASTRQNRPQGKNLWASSSRMRRQDSLAHQSVPNRRHGPVKQVGQDTGHDSQPSDESPRSRRFRCHSQHCRTAQEDVLHTILDSYQNHRIQTHWNLVMSSAQRFTVSPAMEANKMFRGITVQDELDGRLQTTFAVFKIKRAGNAVWIIRSYRSCVGYLTSTAGRFEPCRSVRIA